jgi:hypothetical protein
MDDSRFWGMIETAWQAVGGKSKARQKLADRKLSEEKAEELLESLEVVIPALREQLCQLSTADLLAFDRILERKLYDIDRAEIQEHTDGSDDGFLYARGFIVAAGKGYYDAVNAKPSVALMDLECEEMCYLSWHIHEEKFGAVPASAISRESCSNNAGWPGLGQRRRDGLES